MTRLLAAKWSNKRRGRPERAVEEDDDSLFSLLIDVVHFIPAAQENSVRRLLPSGSPEGGRRLTCWWSGCSSPPRPGSTARLRPLLSPVPPPYRLASPRSRCWPASPHTEEEGLGGGGRHRHVIHVCVCVCVSECVCQYLPLSWLPDPQRERHG